MELNSLIKILMWCMSMLQQRDQVGWHGVISTSMQYSAPDSVAIVSFTTNLYGVFFNSWLHLRNGKPFKFSERGLKSNSGGDGVKGDSRGASGCFGGALRMLWVRGGGAGRSGEGFCGEVGWPGWDGVDGDGGLG